MTQHADILARLGEIAQWAEIRGHRGTAREAAALIEAQAAEIARAKEAMSYAEMYLRTGREECPRCGLDQPTADLDAGYELRETMNLLGWPQLETASASGAYRETGSD